MNTRFRRSLQLCCAALALTTAAARAEQLPVKTYTSADGLASDEVFRVFQDSHGFLWFCTSEGLSRFDGYKFTSYGVAQGLPHRIVTDIIETRDGEYWIATLGGLVKYNPAVANRMQATRVGRGVREAPGHVDSADAPGEKFVVYVPDDNEKSKAVTALLKDRAGNIWCGTYGGLYRLEKINKHWQLRHVEIGLPGQTFEDSAIRAIVEGRDDSLWVGTQGGLYHLKADGRVNRYSTEDGLPSDKIFSLVGDREGRVWAGTPAGLCQLSDRPEQGQKIVAHLNTTHEGLIDNGVIALLQSSDSRLWVGTRFGLSVHTPAAAGERASFQNYASNDGLSDIKTKSLFEDRAGNIWVGTESGGALRIARDGFTSYRLAEGLGHIRILSIFENLAGDLHVMSGTSDGGTNDQRFINHFDGKRFTAVRPNLLATKFMGWSWSQAAFQDHAGEWWIPTGEGLFRFPKARDVSQLARARPAAHYTTADGLTGDSIMHLFEDSRGDIWISAIKPDRDFNKVDDTLQPGGDMLTKWERATGTFRRYTEADGVPQSVPTAFAEDRAGQLWIGFYDGHLTRYRDGRFVDFTRQGGREDGSVQTIYFDHAGRLWLASLLGGVTRVDNPEAERPAFTKYTTDQGLSSNQIEGIVEDGWGGIYIGTARGVDRLDVATGRIRHYTTADGLASPGVHSAYKDRHGALWFATLRGLSRLVPQPERAGAPPSIRITAVGINGAPRSVSDLGETEVARLELDADQNQIQIDFLGLGSGESLRYQYKLEGAETDWSAPAENRTVNFPKLAPGSYRFLARAVNTDGATSAVPASVAFTIRPPVWRRPWFVALTALLVASVIYVLIRYRLARLRVLRESENRFRTLAETASDAIITIDERSIIIFVNLAAEKVFGYPSAEMVGADLTTLMPEYLRHLHRAGLSRYAETGRKHVSWEALELPGLHQSGREIPLEISFGEFTKNGQRFFTGIARDITERKRAEEAIRRGREERLHELERVRKRIATDLHDDIGSSLTQISILSEVAHRRMKHDDASVATPLSMIASASRELVDSMSDIVWAINPHKDHLSDLTGRMRRFASDVFTARAIAFHFSAPGAEQDVQLGANVRREVFLIFKESVNNTVKHSGCTEVEIEFRIENDCLSLKLTDNGRGFDAAQESEGHGLVSMRERAAAMGGKLEMMSQTNQGTTIMLLVSLDQYANAARG